MRYIQTYIHTSSSQDPALEYFPQHEIYPFTNVLYSVALNGNWGELPQQTRALLGRNHHQVYRVNQPVALARTLEQKLRCFGSLKLPSLMKATERSEFLLQCSGWCNESIEMSPPSHSSLYHSCTYSGTVEHSAHWSTSGPVQGNKAHTLWCPPVLSSL